MNAHTEPRTADGNPDTATCTSRRSLRLFDPRVAAGESGYRPITLVRHAAQLLIDSGRLPGILVAGEPAPLPLGGLLAYLVSPERTRIRSTRSGRCWSSVPAGTRTGRWLRSAWPGRYLRR